MRDAAGRGPVLQIGMDTPQLTGDLMAEARDALFRRGVDAVVGPASDGGWWSLGLRNAQMTRALFDVPMSTSDTCELTIRALRADGLRVALLPMLTDVDTFADAIEVAECRTWHPVRPCLPGHLEWGRRHDARVVAVRGGSARR